MDPHFFAFLGIAVLVIVSPGPDTALVIRNSLLSGWVGGTATAVGVVTGQAVWALATAVGIAELLVGSQPIFLALKMLGAAYLVFLGVQGIRAALGPPELSGGRITDGRSAARPMRSFRQGIINDLGNPKMAAFFTSLLPQFAPKHGGTFVALMVLGLSFCAMTLVWLTIYAAVIARFGDVLRRGWVRRMLEGLTGAVLIALGVRLMAEHR